MFSGGSKNNWIFQLSFPLLFLFSVLIIGIPHSTETDFKSICKIQGTGFHSPYEGRTLRTQGVVIGDLDTTSRRGFFIQADHCDDDERTSDGVFVYLGERVDIVNAGDQVEIVGKVQEYYGLTEIVVKPVDVTIISSGSALPTPIELYPPFDNTESNRYFEQLEGMRVSLAKAIAVGPTGKDDRSWLANADLNLQRVFYDDPRGTGEILCVDDEGSFELDPEVKVGDQVTDLLAVQDYRGGEFCLQLFAAPLVYPVSQIVFTSPINVLHKIEATLAAPASDGIDFRVASFNLANLFDTVDDPETEDTVLSAGEYQNRLSKRAHAIHDVLAEPEIIALQEAENEDVLQALVNRPEIEADYAYVLQDGPDMRGIDVALLYRTDRVSLVTYQVRQGCTKLVDGLGPDGNLDVYDPQNALTCDTDGDGKLDGNRLFSRPPLVVHLRIYRMGSINALVGDVPNETDTLDIWVISNHWKSKLQDTETTQYTLPRRKQQAQFVASLADEIIAQELDPIIVVLGDLNDHIGSPPLAILGENLDNQMAQLSQSERYTYVHRGVSQVLDHILLRMHLPIAPVNLTIHHINADYPAVFDGVADSYYRSSDHDLLSIAFTDLEQYTYLPVIRK